VQLRGRGGSEAAVLLKGARSREEVGGTGRNVKEKFFVDEKFKETRQRREIPQGNEKRRGRPWRILTENSASERETCERRGRHPSGNTRKQELEIRREREGLPHYEKDGGGTSEQEGNVKKGSDKTLRAGRTHEENSAELLKKETGGGFFPSFETATRKKESDLDLSVPTKRGNLFQAAVAGKGNV